VPAGHTSGALYGGLVGSGTGSLKAAYSLLLSRGTIRIPLPWPPRSKSGGVRKVEFDLTITAADDRPGCNTDPSFGLRTGLVSVYRRPPSAAQMDFKTLRADGSGPALTGSIMWDGREPSLEQQAIDATRGHAQADRDPTPEQVAEIVALQTQVFTAQQYDHGIGRLDQHGAGGGPLNLARQIPLPAGGFTFAEYGNWGGLDGKFASIARGQTLFNNRRFSARNVDGFNDLPGVGNPALFTTCSTCHNIAASGADFFENPQRNIGIGGTATASGGPAPAKDLPRFTLTCRPGARPGFQGLGPIVTNDPGLALITGKCADIGKFTVPQLRALAAREPYFHDGSARSLGEVVTFYNKRFGIGLTAAEQQDLVNFLAAL
jgi:cytochrome c peroxidase